MEKEKNLLTEWLETYFDEVEPLDFYRDIFPAGELEEKGVSVNGNGKYNAICVCVSRTEQRQVQKKRRQPDGTWKKETVFDEDGKPKTESKIYRFTVNDDLSVIGDLQDREDLFCLMAPLSYAGKARSAENGRFMYAMAFDVDHLRVLNGKPVGLMNLWSGHIINAERLPKPTYIVSSGTGVHLYYVFSQPIPLFANIVKQLQALKRELTAMIWNEGIVDIKSEKEIQFEGIWQGFRVVGTTTKKGDKTRAFLTGDKVTLEYLNGFVREAYQVTEFAYKSRLTRAQAKEKYPEWYEHRIVKGKKGVSKPWAVKRDLYEWWKREIMQKATVGHRYYCLMMLAIYAKKCSFYDAEKNPYPVTYEQLEKDAFKVMEYFETLTVTEDNHFDEEDVLSALEAYEDGLLTYPRDSIEYRSGFPLPKNKRNGRKQADHVIVMNTMKALKKQLGEEVKDGRPKGSGTAKGIIIKYLVRHPTASKAEVIRGTGKDKKTVYKYYEAAKEAAAQICSAEVPPSSR